MSFDVFLQYAQREAPAIDLEARVAAVVVAFGGGERDELGYFFELRNGEPVEMFMGANRDGAMLALRVFTDETARFLFELLKATGWSALTGEEGAISASAIAPAQVHDGFPQITGVGCAEDVLRFFAPSFENWSDYRDQVVKDH